MALTPKQRIKYRWTEQDVQIANGNTAGNVQEGYVTPYGIPASAVPNAKGLSGARKDTAGNPVGLVDIELARSNWGQPGLAQRFKETAVGTDKTSFTVGEETYDWKWQPVGALVEGVSTLGELCDKLHQTSTMSYPVSFYDRDRWEAKDGTRHDVENSAKVLFDHWSNTDYRHAVLSSGIDLNTYLTNPASLPVKAGGETIQCVLVAVCRLRVVVGTPQDPNNLMGDPLVISILEYIRELDENTNAVAELLAQCQNALTFRLEVVRDLAALQSLAKAESGIAMFEKFFATEEERAAAEKRLGTDIVTGESRPNTKYWREIDTTLAKVIPKMHDMLVQKPIAVELTKKGEFLSAVQIPDGAAALRDRRQRLSRLLHDSAIYVDAIKAWLKSRMRTRQEKNKDGSITEVRYLTPYPLDLFERLHRALEKAVKAEASAGQEEADEQRLDEYFDGTPEIGITNVDTIQTKSPVAFVLKVLGKNLTLTKSGSSLLLTIVTVKAKLEITRLCEAVANVGFGPTNFPPSLLLPAANRIAAVLPMGSKTRTAIESAIQAGDAEALKAQANAYADDLKKMREGQAYDAATKSFSTSHYQLAMDALNIVSFVITVSNGVKEGQWERETLSVVSMYTSGLKVAIGTLRNVLGALGGFKATIETLKFAGNAFDGIAGFLGIITGGIGFLEAWDKGDGLGMFESAVGVTGSFAGLVVAIYGGAAAAPVAAVVAGVCALVGGVVGVVKSVTADRSDRGAAADYAGSLIRGVCDSEDYNAYKHVLCKECREKDPDVKAGLERVYLICAGNHDLPTAEVDAVGNNVKALRRAGFGDDTIKLVLKPWHAAPTADPLSSLGDAAVAAP